MRSKENIARSGKNAKREPLERILLEGLDSGEPIRVTEEYWANLSARLEQCAQSEHEALENEDQ